MAPQWNGLDMKMAPLWSHFGSTFFFQCTSCEPNEILWYFAHSQRTSLQQCYLPNAHFSLTA